MGCGDRSPAAHVRRDLSTPIAPWSRDAPFLPLFAPSRPKPPRRGADPPPLADLGLPVTVGLLVPSGSAAQEANLGILEERLQNELEAVVNRFDGVAGIHVVDLTEAVRTGGSGVLNILTDEGSALSLEDHAIYMIVYSDNTSTNVLPDELGMAEVNARAASLGAPQTIFQRKMIQPQASAKGDENLSTPGEAARIMERIAACELPRSTAACARVTEILALPKGGPARAAVPGSIPIAFKPGGITGVAPVWAVVQLPVRPCVLSVMANCGGDGGSVVREASEAAYSYFSKLAGATPYGTRRAGRAIPSRSTGARDPGSQPTAGEVQRASHPGGADLIPHRIHSLPFTRIAWLWTGRQKKDVGPVSEGRPARCLEVFHAGRAKPDPVAAGSTAAESQRRRLTRPPRPEMEEGTLGSEGATVRATVPATVPGTVPAATAGTEDPVASPAAGLRRQIGGTDSGKDRRRTERHSGPENCLLDEFPAVSETVLRIVMSAQRSSSALAP